MYVTCKNSDVFQNTIINTFDKVEETEIQKLNKRYGQRYSLVLTKSYGLPFLQPPTVFMLRRAIVTHLVTMGDFQKLLTHLLT